jgi:hypothetical protein
MAIQIQGNGGTTAEVDGTTFRAMRFTPRPVDHGSLGAYSVSSTSGTMAAALSANSEIFQFRWPDATNLALIHRVQFSAGANVAATAAGLFSVRMTAARSWTAAGSGGTRLTMTGNNAKLRTSMGTSLVNDIGISTTAALTAGTKTLDTQDISTVSTGIITGAITVAPTFEIFPLSDLFDSSENLFHPIVLAQNEGFVLRIGAAAPASMTWHFSVNVVWQEVASY